MATKTELNWKTVDPSSLPKEHAALYQVYKAAYAKASEARKAFEAKMNADARLPAGKVLAFGYRFGQLGVAIADTTKPSVSSKAMSLGDFLQANR